MNCSNCGHEQVFGKFCSSCGTKFEEPQLDTVIATRAQSNKPNIHLENLKRRLKNYSAYFIQKLKKPSHTYNHGETEFTSSFVSIILFIVLLTISSFIFTRNLYWSNPPSFLSFFMEALLLTFFMILIVIVSLFLINNFFGPQHSFKTIICYFGAQLSPLIIGVAISMLLMLVKSFTYGNIFLSICIIFGLFILPLHVISIILSKKESFADPLYGFILYIVTFTILFILFISIVGVSTISGYFDHLNYLF